MSHDSQKTDRNEEIRAKAKNVLLEIIRQSTGDSFRGKTRLYKAFYFAHLFYVQQADDYLTEWPIVKMDFGPGISEFDILINELERDGLIKESTEKNGPFTEICYTIIDPNITIGLTPTAVEAIRETTAFIDSKSATELTHITHEHSDSWNAAIMGGEMDIYRDVYVESSRSARRMTAISKALDEVF